MKAVIYYITWVIFLVLSQQSLAEERKNSLGLDNDHQTSLVLNGRGTRKFMFFDLYTCELYVLEPTDDSARILRENGPITVQLKVHGDPPESIPGEWAAVLKGELSDKMFSKTTILYRDLEKGDRIQLQYQPETGTTVAINSESLFVDPGRELIQAVLDQWVGEAPVSDELKAAFLGK